MKITLYYNESEKFVMNKTLNFIGDITGTLKQATSLLNPNIDLEMLTNGIIEYNIDVQYENNDISYIDDGEEFDVNIKMSTSIFECNYCYIEEFDRFYFIDNIIIQNNKLFVLILSVDPLESHKAQILNQEAFILRNEFDYNPYVIDNYMSYYCDADVIEFIADNGSMVNMTFNANINDKNTKNIAINVINDKGEDKFTTALKPSGTNLPNVNTGSTACDFSSTTYVMDYENMRHLAQRLYTQDYFAEWILSLMCLPFEIPVEDNTPSLLNIGGHDMKQEWLGGLKPKVECYEPESNIPQYYIIADFKIDAESFIDYEPFTKYQIFLPYCAWVDVNANDILNNRIIVSYSVNVTNGASQVTIYDVTNNKLIYTSSCQLGVSIPITLTNAYECRKQEQNNATSFAIGMISNVGKFVGGAISQNAGSMAGAVGGALGSVLQYDIANSNIKGTATGQITSPTMALYLPQDVIIRKTRIKPKNYNEDFFKLYGRPLNAYKNLSELKGYTKVGDIHLVNMKATKQEIEQIDTILKNGFIIG